jgi:hypothetical protein
MQKENPMMRLVIQASLVGFVVALAGCSSGDDDSTGSGGSGGTAGSGGGGGSGGMTAMCETKLTATEATNYKFSSSLTVDVTKVQTGSDVKFDWSGVKKDLLGHDLNLSTIGMVEVELWTLTQANFEKKLNDDALGQSDLAIIASIIPTAGSTTSDIYQLTDMGMPYTKEQIDPYLNTTTYPPDKTLYTVMLADGMTYGKGTRMIAGFTFDPTVTNTQVNVTSDSTQLSLTADLHSQTVLTVPAATPAITLDWTTMTKTAAGLVFEPTYVTQIRVGKYSKSATDLEDKTNFLNLDTIADTMYTADVTAGTTFDLSQTKDPSGAAFPGIDSTHTWIVALNCTEQCTNPAPWYIAVLKTCN